MKLPAYKAGHQKIEFSTYTIYPPFSKGGDIKGELFIKGFEDSSEKNDQ
jgi:hypothetical protein